MTLHLQDNRFRVLRVLCSLSAWRWRHNIPSKRRERHMTEGQNPPPHRSDDQKTSANQFQTSNLSPRPKLWLGRVRSHFTLHIYLAAASLYKRTA